VGSAVKGCNPASFRITPKTILLPLSGLRIVLIVTYLCIVLVLNFVLLPLAPLHVAW
jgi:hypothetical protein